MTMEPLAFPPIDDMTRLRVAFSIGQLVRSWVLCFCQVEAAMNWRLVLEDPGKLTYRRTGVWVKPDGMPQYSGDRPGMGYESIVMMHAPGRSEWNGGGKHGVFVFNKNGGESGPNDHPTQKPLPLMKSQDP
jgi:site-specific DNA-methyltransferase (adenine-specific)